MKHRAEQEQKGKDGVEGGFGNGCTDVEAIIDLGETGENEGKKGEQENGHAGTKFATEAAGDELFLLVFVWRVFEFVVVDVSDFKRAYVVRLGCFFLLSVH